MAEWVGGVWCGLVRNVVVRVVQRVIRQFVLSGRTEITVIGVVRFPVRHIFHFVVGCFYDCLSQGLVRSSVVANFDFRAKIFFDAFCKFLAVAGCV